MLKIGLIGCGYWGKKLARNFISSKYTKLEFIADTDKKNKENYKHIRDLIFTRNYKKIIDKVDAVAIATPTEAHFRIAYDVIKRNKHLMITKPPTKYLHEMIKLKKEAEKRKLVLLIDFTFLYTDSIQHIKKIIKSKKMGKIYSYESMRQNLGIFNKHENVIMDLACHDISIILFIFGKMPIAVSATGSSFLPKKQENNAQITLFFKNNFVSYVNCSWLSPIKNRNIIIAGEKSMLLYNDLEKKRKIRLFYYNKKIRSEKNRHNVHKMLENYSKTRVYIPKLKGSEALKNEISDFATCIKKRKIPISNSHVAVNVTKILNAANMSIKKKGALIKIR